MADITQPLPSLTDRQIKILRAVVEKYSKTAQSVGSEVLARADKKAVRKDVTAKLYGGDQTRKDKLLKKQKKGKKRLAQFGKVRLESSIVTRLFTDS